MPAAVSESSPEEEMDRALASDFLMHMRSEAQHLSCASPTPRGFCLCLSLPVINTLAVFLQRLMQPTFASIANVTLSA